MDKIWLSSPHMGGSELGFVKEAFNTNWIAPTGPNIIGFEKELCDLVNSKYSLAVSSGTAAIHLALNVLGVNHGDVVLTQSFTFCASANPVKYQGATPVFIGSENESWNMSPEALVEAIEYFKRKSQLQKVKAIIPVHLFGMPANMHEICRIADQYGIPVIEDAAESLGSTIAEQYTGTFGAIGVFSFNGNKIITTSGGGAMVANDGHLLKLAGKLATQAREIAPHYEHELLGYNYRMSNVCAGIGRGQLQVLKERVQQRRKNFDRYVELFRSLNWPINFQLEKKGNYSNRWLTAVYFSENEFDKNFNSRLMRHLESKEIESRPLWKPMHIQPLYKSELYFGDETEVKLFDTGLCLPSGSNLMEDDWNRISSAIQSFETT